MAFGTLKLLYIVSCIVLGLTILLPTFALVIKLPPGEKFSELYILGPNRMAEDYPFNVSTGSAEKIYVGISNHMGGVENYVLYVKLRNQTESSPNNKNGIASALPPVFEYHVSLQDNSPWEKEIMFSLRGISFAGNLCRVASFTIDSMEYTVDKVASWDQQYHGFYVQLFFELWHYDTLTAGFKYHNRFVGILMNITMPEE